MKNCMKTSLLCVGKTPGVLPIMVGHTGRLGPKFSLQVYKKLGITKLFTQESSSLSLKITLQSGKACIFPPRRNLRVYPRWHRRYGRLSSHLAERHFGRHRPSDLESRIFVLPSQTPRIQDIVKLCKLIWCRFFVALHK